MKYADVIVNISHENLDKTYEYIIPVELEEKIIIGSQVWIPFGAGNREIRGFVLNISNTPQFDPKKLKEIKKLVENSVVLESHYIQLAYWIKENYGSTMNDALRTVLPIKKTVKKKEKRWILLAIEKEKAKIYLEEFFKKNNKARVRLLEAVIKESKIDYDIALHELKISRTVIKALEEKGIIKIGSKTTYRNPIQILEKEPYEITLNDQQQKVADTIIKQYLSGIRANYLIHGITGSGKTEIYIEIIQQVIKEGKQVIMLIPEIALTYQTVMRFYKKFGERISVMHSRLSDGQKYDQYLRAQNGEIDIMIGPRSVLFTPFEQLGLIIMDEEHENSYKSEKPPKYHARETAIARAKMLEASVILGSATPSMDSYYRAKKGEIQLLTLTERAGTGQVPYVWVVDLREELKQKNRSIFSRKLKALMEDRLRKKQQIMLFINRRGYAGFVSCRSCGYVMKCPHCDVSLTSHTTGSLVCHYCDYKIQKPNLCPECKSKYIASFGTGTQRIEEYVKKEFPQAKILRMDADTTKGKNGHEKILSSFSNHEADILIGTQMIVKGHDFPNVTLVGIVAADLSLYANDYKASERTFQLLCQAAGRAGRGKEKGEVVIQTYNPEHYSIMAAAENNYEAFYEKEMAFRTVMEYPPAGNFVAILITSKKEEDAKNGANLIGGAIGIYANENQINLIKIEKTKRKNLDDRKSVEEKSDSIKLIGPAKASISKIKDSFRYILYLKSKQYDNLKNCKDFLEGYIECSEYLKKVTIQFDFDPMNGY